MTTPSKAAMDAAKDAKLTLRIRTVSGYNCVATYHVNLAQWVAICEIAEGRPSSQSAALLDVLERLTVIVDDQLDGDFPEALEQARAAILAAKGGQS